MKLYFSPLACSLADHIALREAGFVFDLERVNLKTHQCESGVDLRAVSGKPYVPALRLDDGEVLTENVAILDYIASVSPALQVDGRLGRTRVLEALTYITTEIHRAFKPMWHGGSAEDKAKAATTIGELMVPMAGQMQGDFLFGDRPSVADFYLFVMLLWAQRFGVDTPAPLTGLRLRLAARPAVRAAMAYEGLIAA